MSERTLRFTTALRSAGVRALAVMWGGVVALALYLLVVSVGPQLEGQYAPVIKNYRMTQVVAVPNGFSFVPRFSKVRDCTAYGTSWFAPDPNTGDLMKLLTERIAGEPNSPQTGPLGTRVGVRQAIFPPPGAAYVMAIVNHDCGFVWQTRTTLGPFMLVDGMPAAPSPNP